MTTYFTDHKLRKKKRINYHDMLLSKVDKDESSAELSDTSDDGSSSGSELFSKKKKLPKLVDKDFTELLSNTEVEEETNEYRKQRLKNMEDRLIVLKTLDFDDDVFRSSSIVKKSLTPNRKLPVKTVVLPRKRSERLMNRSICDQNSTNSGTENSHSMSLDIETVDKDNRYEGELNFSKSEEKQFLESLKDVMDIPHPVISDFSSCNFEEFSMTVKSCYMLDNPLKIIPSRICSLDLHPSEKKLLILAGDKSGNISLWDVLENTGVQINSHTYSVNCVSFSSQDNSKYFTTSLDGTIRQGDINKNSSNLIYMTSYDKNDHTTWHHELGHSLLVAEGGHSGVVKVIDTRALSSNYPSFKCHTKSVRTVQSHPNNDNYFLTSSGDRCFGIWDLRLIKNKNPAAIILQSFSKALTSAFYSAQGNYILTTDNNDRICVFQPTDNAAKKITDIHHNNHGGRWLSVFKARWQPKREDCFYVGSLSNNPKRIQVYKRGGEILHELKSETMTTYNPVIAVHPTKSVIVGGNGSGRIHVFAPFHNFSDL